MSDLLFMDLPTAETILLIQHRISDLETWLGTYAMHEEAREQYGVRRTRIFKPDGDPPSVMVLHFFDTNEAAENFRTFLREQLFNTAEGTRGMSGEPSSVILHEVNTGPKT